MSRSLRTSRRLLASIFVLGAGCAAAQQCVAPPTGLVYWLAGDGDYDDRAGFYNGSVSGQVEFVPGKVGEALAFDDASDRVDPRVTQDEGRVLENTFTWEFWARPTATTPECPESQEGNCSVIQQAVAILPLPSPAGSDEAGVGVIVGTNAVCVFEHAGFHLPCLLRHDATLNDWTHIAVVMENRVPRLYLNGQLARVGLASPRAHAFARWDAIGAGFNLGSYRGDLDEVSLYNRALTDAEIQGLFAAGSTGKCESACFEHHDDLFEHASVTANSGIVSTSLDGLFGATNILPEVDSLIFQDNQPDGFSHSLEWHTAAPVTLERFALSAFAGQPPAFQRAFRDFKLFARDMLTHQFVPVYDSPVRTPYPAIAGNYRLYRCANVRPMLAQEFRAEFVQHGEGPFFGPRVMELDGFGPDLIFADAFEVDAP